MTHPCPNLLPTLGDTQWVLNHWDEIRAVLPETWTHMQNVNMLSIGYKLKLLGIDWRNEEEFGHCMLFFEVSGILLRDGYLLRRSVH